MAIRGGGGHHVNYHSLYLCISLQLLSGVFHERCTVQINVVVIKTVIENNNNVILFSHVG